MQLAFHKYQATGNDFILVDDRAGQWPAEQWQAWEQLCDRHMGIGADGVILLRLHPTAAFEMVYLNADGRLSSFCGNGSRAALHFARALGIVLGEQINYLASDGIHRGQFIGEEIRTELKVQSSPSQLTDTDWFVHTGSPHYVRFVDELPDAETVLAEGRRIRNLPAYAPGGTNVNFVHADAEGTLHVRTYERGVEAETLSCGTGVTAAALCQHARGLGSFPYAIQALGGRLQVLREEGSLWLQGAAVETFRGVVHFPS
jgi:diaminopimelate epimerase